MPPQPKKARMEAPAASETTIDKLNDDVLVEVFSYLDSANLKTAALVCKQWNDVIGMSAVTMKKFRLKLNKGFFASNGSGLRKHQRVELDVEVLGRALNNLHRFNVLQAKHAIISGKAKVEYRQLARFLSLMPLLERLDFYDGNYTNDSQVQLVNLPKLRDFINITDEYLIYDFINADNLNKLMCVSFTQKEVVSVPRAEKFKSFLTRCKKLTTLLISECMFIELFHLNEMPAMEFKLESFSLSCTIGPSFDQNISFYRFEQFLISQAPTLTKLSISLQQENLKFTPDVYKMIFSRLTLKDFSVRCNALPIDQQFYDNMQPLESLRKLTIETGSLVVRPSNLFAVKKFLRKCPNIETLDLELWIDCEILKHVARYNQKVTRLSIKEIPKVFPDDLQFRSLKEFKVCYIRRKRGICDFSHFLSVIKNCPEIETIDIPFDEILFTADVVGELMKQPKLMKLTFYRGNNDTNKIFSVIKEKRKGAEMLIEGRWEKTTIKFSSQLN